MCPACDHVWTVLKERSHIVQGRGIVYRADGSLLPGERKYSFTLHAGENLVGGADPPPGTWTIGDLYIELHGGERLDFNGQEFMLQRVTGRALRFIGASVAAGPHASTVTLLVTTANGV
jgi:hypothetical protein